MEKETQFTFNPKWCNVVYETPAKKIIKFDEVEAFQKTQVFESYCEFLYKLQQSIKSKKISQTLPIQKFKPFEDYFERLYQILAETPPIDQPMRYGNKAFKNFYEKALQHTQHFLSQLFPHQGIRTQLYRYIAESFGSNVRIDYGTGHEMSFMFFCWALYRLGSVSDEQLEQLVRQVFYAYISLMRKVQLQYMLQPAGSHGVWGLDDYHFLPFLLGAAEIIGNQELQSPNCINKPVLVEKYFHEYMYLNCVKFIMQAKKGIPFAQSSPVLNNIAGAASWEKIAGGMIKMYRVEVLGKHPVIKHQYFGTIIKYE